MSQSLLSALATLSMAEAQNLKHFQGLGFKVLDVGFRVQGFRV